MACSRQRHQCACRFRDRPLIPTRRVGMRANLPTYFIFFVDQLRFQVKDLLGQASESRSLNAFVWEIFNYVKQPT